MAIFSCNGNVTTPDLVLNTLYGCLLPLTFLTSLLLNPVIFYYNFKQRSSVGSLLFQLLALSDFITCLYQPLVLTLELWSPHVKEVRHESTPLRIVSTLVMAAVIFGSGVLTNLLALTRYIKIKYPFICIKRKVVVVVAGVNLAVFWGIMTLLILTSGSRYFDTRIQLVWYEAHTIESMVMLALFGIQSLVATATSIATVYELRRARAAEEMKFQDSNKSGREIVRKKRASQTRGGLTILIMNLGNMTLVIFVVMFMTETLGDIDPGSCSKLYNFTVFNMVGFIPITLSAVNPLIITFRSSGVRCMLLGRVIDITMPLAGDTTLNGRSIPSPLPSNRKYVRSTSGPANGSGLIIHNLTSIMKSASATSVMLNNNHNDNHSNTHSADNHPPIKSDDRRVSQ